MPFNRGAVDAKPFEAMFMGFRVEKAAAALPQTTTATLFTIAGGRVLVTMIVGEVTTLIQTQANNTKLTFNPDDAGASQDICAVLDISADAVGTMYHISGTLSDALRDNLNLARGGLMAAPLILKPGTILLDCAASSTGQAKWTIWYIPLEDGASIS